MSDLLNTAQAAELLGVSRERVRQLARRGRLHGKHIGRDWIFERIRIEEFAITPRPSPGRPRNTNLLELALRDADIWRSRAEAQQEVIKMIAKYLPSDVALISQSGWYIGIEEPTP